MTTYKKQLIFSLVLVISCFFLFKSYQHWKAEYDFNRGLKQTAYKQYKKAIPHYQKAISRFPSEDFYRLHYAKNYLDLARIQHPTIAESIAYAKKAQQVLETLHQRDPINPWYLLRLSETVLMLSYFYPQKKESYILKYGNYLKLAYESDRNNPIFIESYAKYLHSIKQYEEALPLLEKVYKIDPSMKVSAQLITQIYHLQSRYDESLPISKKLYLDTPNNTKYLELYLESLYLNSQVTQAIQLLRPYALLDNAPFKLREFYAFLIYQNKAYKSAEKLYLKLIEEKPELYTLHQTLAEIYDRSGNAQKAKTLIRNYQKKYPSKEAQSYYDELIAR